MGRRRHKSGTEWVITLVFTAIILFFVFKLVLRVGDDSLAPLKSQKQEQPVQDDFQEMPRVEAEPEPRPSLELAATEVPDSVLTIATVEQLPSAAPTTAQPVIAPTDLVPAGVATIEVPKDVTKAYCRTNLRAIVDAAIRIARRTKSDVLPVDLMELRTEFPDASVLICPNELPSINASLDWESFDPKLISYPVYNGHVKGTDIVRPKVDLRYLACPVHKIYITGGGNVMDAKSSTTMYVFPHR